jgi:hypothetical protein
MSASDHINREQHRRPRVGDFTPWGIIGHKNWWGPLDSPEGELHTKAMNAEWEDRESPEGRDPQKKAYEDWEDRQAYDYNKQFGLD